MKRLRGLRRRLVAGFTLIESMVVVALAAIVIALVAPSVSELLAAQRVQSINAELVTNLQFARAEAVRRNSDVLVQFASSATTSCYVMYFAEAVSGRCNCLRPQGRACSGGFEEIRTVQIPKALAVALAASSGMDRIVTFQPITGRSLPGDFVVDVKSDVRGALRTAINIAGRPTVCTPDGSIRLVPRCEQ